MSRIIKPNEVNKPKSVIHRSKLFKGRKTAEEVHREYGMRGRCSLCGGAPVILVRMLALIEDVKKQSMPYWVALCQSAASNGQVDNAGNVKVPYVNTTYGKMIRISQALACRDHRKDLEVTAARAPSWVLVEIDRGPGADNPVVQVGV